MSKGTKRKDNTTDLSISELKACLLHEKKMEKKVETLQIKYTSQCKIEVEGETFTIEEGELF